MKRYIFEIKFLQNRPIYNVTKIVFARMCSVHFVIENYDIYKKKCVQYTNEVGFGDIFCGLFLVKGMHGHVFYQNVYVI